ncbi:hypothetical protein D3C85_1741700 [compost metagenome]
MWMNMMLIRLAPPISRHTMCTNLRLVARANTGRMKAASADTPLYTANMMPTQLPASWKAADCASAVPNTLSATALVV